MCLILFPCVIQLYCTQLHLWSDLFWFLCMGTFLGLLPASGLNFIVTASLEIYFLVENIDMFNTVLVVSSQAFACFFFGMISERRAVITHHLPFWLNCLACSLYFSFLFFFGRGGWACMSAHLYSPSITSAIRPSVLPPPHPVSFTLSANRYGQPSKHLKGTLWLWLLAEDFKYTSKRVAKLLSGSLKSSKPVSTHPFWSMTLEALTLTKRFP